MAGMQFACKMWTLMILACICALSQMTMDVWTGLWSWMWLVVFSYLITYLLGAGRGRSGGRHCTAGLSCYIPLGRHLLSLAGDRKKEEKKQQQQQQKSYVQHKCRRVDTKNSTNITRRVAVYLETHCNIGWKSAFLTGILDR